MQRPKRVNRTRVEADFVHARVADQFAERGHDIRLPARDEQPLGVESPEQVVMLQRGDELLGRGFVQPQWSVALPNRVTSRRARVG